MRHIQALYPSSRPGANFIEELCERSDFEVAIKDIRSKWNIDVSTEIYLSENTEDYHLSEQSNLSKNKKFIADINTLQKKFQLGVQWFSFIEEYIFIDILVYYMASNFFIEKRTGKECDPITGEPAYYLRIFPETTEKDITRSWGDINKFIHGKKIKPKRQKHSKFFKRDRKIYKLIQLGFGVGDIQEFFLEHTHKKLDADLIFKADFRYRKKMGIKDGKKLGYRKSLTPLTDMQKIASEYPDD
jgi:hypothetical protein